VDTTTVTICICHKFRRPFKCFPLLTWPSFANIDEANDSMCLKYRPAARIHWYCRISFYPEGIWPLPDLPALPEQAYPFDSGWISNPKCKDIHTFLDHQLSDHSSHHSVLFYMHLRISGRGPVGFQVQLTMCLSRTCYGTPTS
jgi:hypothetical protein